MEAIIQQKVKVNDTVQCSQCKVWYVKSQDCPSCPRCRIAEEKPVVLDYQI